MNYMASNLSNGLQFNRKNAAGGLDSMSYSTPIVGNGGEISPKCSPRYFRVSPFGVIPTAAFTIPPSIDPPPLPPPVMGPDVPPVPASETVDDTVIRDDQPIMNTIIQGTMIPSECNIKYQDFELIHHYSFHTDSIIMMQNNSEKHVWDRVVPRVSFAYPYLSDALLAISGLHLQYLSNGKRDLRSYALEKYYNAMASSQVHDITTSFEPKFLTSCFLMMLAFSFDEILDLISFDGKLDVFALARGPFILAQRLFPFLNKGPLSALLYKVPGKDNDFDRSMELELPAFENLFDVLGVICQPTGSVSVQETPPSSTKRESRSISSNSSNSTDTSSSNIASPSLEADSPMFETMVYQIAIERLIAIVKAAIYFNAPPLLITWITLVSNDFINLARRNSPFAKIIVAYYMAALYVCKQFFWIGDRPVREVYKIANSLSSDWDNLMAWPLRIIQKPNVTLSDLLEASMWIPESTDYEQRV